MNPIRLLQTVASLTVTVWLGASFLMTAEPVPEAFAPLTSHGVGLTSTALPVPAAHPHAHRKGAAFPVRLDPPPLPKESSSTSAVDTGILDLFPADAR